MYEGTAIVLLRPLTPTERNGMRRATRRASAVMGFVLLAGIATACTSKASDESPRPTPEPTISSTVAPTTQKIGSIDACRLVGLRELTEALTDGAYGFIGTDDGTKDTNPIIQLRECRYQGTGGVQVHIQSTLDTEPGGTFWKTTLEETRGEKTIEDVGEGAIFVPDAKSLVFYKGRAVIRVGLVYSRSGPTIVAEQLTQISKKIDARITE